MTDWAAGNTIQMMFQLATWACWFGDVIPFSAALVFSVVGIGIFLSSRD